MNGTVLPLVERLVSQFSVTGEVEVGPVSLEWGTLLFAIFAVLWLLHMLSQHVDEEYLGDRDTLVTTVARAIERISGISMIVVIVAYFTRAAAESIDAGEPPAEWLPLIAFPVWFVLFVAGYELVSMRYGERPEDEPFRPADWYALGGLATLGFGGLAYLLLGYGAIPGVVMAFFGMLLFALVLVDQFRRPGTEPARS